MHDDLETRPTARSAGAPRLRLSDGQERLWYLEQIAVAAPVHHVSAATLVEGPLDAGRLTSALRACVARHDLLRSTFEDRGNGPRRTVRATADVPLRRLDVEGGSAPGTDAGGGSVAEAELRRVLAEESARPFALDRAPALRATLVRSGAERHVLLLTAHRIVADRASLTVLERELACEYAASGEDLARMPPSTAHRPASDPPAMDPLASDPLASEPAAPDEGLLYWKRRLAGLPPLDLPFDRTRPRTPTHRATGRELLLDDRHAEALKRLAREEGVPAWTVPAVAFTVLLARWTGRYDVVSGIPVDRRPPAVARTAFGPYEDLLLLRVDLTGRPSLREAVRRFAHARDEAERHADVPFGRLVRLMGQERDLSRHPLCQAVFAVAGARRTGFTAAGLSTSALTLDDATVPYDLQCTVTEDDGRGGLGAELRLASDLWLPESADRMATALRALLIALAETPDRRIAEIPVLSPEDRARIDAWNATDRPLPEPATVDGLFLAWADRVPQAVALTDRTGTWTYARLRVRAERVGRALIAAGVTPDSVVALPMRRSADLVTGMLGVLLAGGAPLVLDPGHPVERLRFMAEDVEISAVLGNAEPPAWLHGLGVPVLRLTDAEHDGTGAGDPQRQEPASADREPGTRPASADRGAGTPAAPEPALAPAVATGPERQGPPAAGPAHDRPAAAGPAHVARCPVGPLPWSRSHPVGLAAVVYTSGSTGRPKAVGIPHRAVVRLTTATDYVSVGPGDVLLHLGDPAFDITAFEVWGALCNGARVDVLPGDEPLGPDEVLAALRELRPTIVALTGTLFNRVTDIDPRAFGGLRHLFVVGEVMDPRRTRAVLRGGAPPGHLHNGYGPSENATFSTTHRVDRLPEDAPSVPIGSALTNTTLHVLDQELGPVPIGVTGELYVGGLGLARGYLGRPGRTAERFLPDPFAPGPGALMYRTGDLVRRLPDGALDFLGRADQQVKIRGYRIEPGEIEAALLARDDVRECVVRAVDVAGDRRLVAYVVPGPGHRPSPPELLGGLRDRLPSHMVPGHVLLLDELPTTPSGKIDGRALPGIAEDAAGPPDAGTVPPRTATERALWEIWADALRVRSFGVHDSFFLVGGHSLLASVVRTAVRERLGVALPLRTLFDVPTLAGLADEVEGAAGEAAAVPATARTDDDPEQLDGLVAELERLAESRRAEGRAGGTA
ncbi:AMP-binding protein [Streptomyces rishiriensis]|uniref:non-ribosomal peptide synthetase n=1 Tax=Streptomyces rishiriensis TaxID=68264 RepID=UPI0033DD525C